MDYTSQGSSSSDTKVHTYSKECLKSYEALQKQYDQQYEAFKKYHLEIIAYQVGLESLESRIVVHEKNEAVYEEDIKILKIDVMLRDNALSELKNQMKNALKENDDLKFKLEKFETSSHNLTKLINCQLSANDKTGLGYDSQMNKSDLNDVYVNESQVIGNILIDSHESDGEDNKVNDKFKKSKGYYAVLPPYKRNYMPLRAKLSYVGLDDSVFKIVVSETATSVNEIETSTSKISKETLEKPKTIWPSAPIIEEWESDSKDENVVEKTEVKKTVKPKLETIKFVNARNTTVENESKVEKPVKKPVKYAEMYNSQKPRGNKRNWNNQKSQQLGNNFVMHNKACYICGSFYHLQYTCKQKRHLNGKREEKPVWNNVGRVNHQNSLRITHLNLKRHMVPRRILTRSGLISLNTARQSHLNDVCYCFSRQVNTARPKAVINDVRTNRVNDVKASACWV
uniref:Ribonuclease H-like domain-containing protein n=1 Tax=Tanacetum cinerariifolium TaxID=118510 RepID=A0A699HV44_TANCI|nr:ribonuclease H-like domain-containing protein [Tanacetum cinerariifolium]